MALAAGKSRHHEDGFREVPVNLTSAKLQNTERLFRVLMHKFFLYKNDKFLAAMFFLRILSLRTETLFGGKNYVGEKNCKKLTLSGGGT